MKAVKRDHLKLLRGWVQFPTGGTARELNHRFSRSGEIPGPTVKSG